MHGNGPADAPRISNTPSVGRDWAVGAFLGRPAAACARNRAPAAIIRPMGDVRPPTFCKTKVREETVTFRNCPLDGLWLIIIRPTIVSKK